MCRGFHKNCILGTSTSRVSHFGGWIIYDPLLSWPGGGQ